MSATPAAESAPNTKGAQTNGENGAQLPPVPAGLADLPPNQIAAILQNLPDIFKNLAEGEAAATLSNLSQSQPSFPGHLAHGAYPPPIHAQQLPPGMEPGPSSHPRGPPNLGQLSAVASGALPMQPQDGIEHAEGEDGAEDDEAGTQSASQGPPTGRRGARSATMTSDEWTRQRKDNHKEVERRRRGNINEGINELGRIVPNGTGEKAKGAILQRAVQYIHHLKENEARNIEKWTLEKLLMDQAMGDLQAQLEEVRRLWDEERAARLRAEGELEVLRGVTGHAPPGQMAAAGATPPPARPKDADAKMQSPATGSPAPAEGEGGKRARTEDGESEDGAKRARVE